QLAELAKDIAIQVHLIDAPDTPDKHHLTARGHAQRPRRTVQVPFLLEVSIGIEYLHAIVRAVGHIDIGVLIDYDIVRSTKLARSRAPVAPVLDQIAFLGELRYARIPVSVGNVGVAVWSNGRVGRLVEVRRRWYGSFDPMSHIDPSQVRRAAAQRLYHAQVAVELNHHIVGRANQPQIVLGIEADAVGDVEDWRAFAIGREERAILVEFQQRIIAAIQ